MIDPRTTNIVGQRVLIARRDPSNSELLGRGVVRVVDCQSSAFAFLIEAVGPVHAPWSGDDLLAEDGCLFQVTSWDETIKLIVDHERTSSSRAAEGGIRAGDAVTSLGGTPTAVRAWPGEYVIGLADSDGGPGDTIEFRGTRFLIGDRPRMPPADWCHPPGMCHLQCTPTSQSLQRISTGLPSLDHVLGGGLVVASVVLLVSPPKMGETSLMLQMLNGLQHRCLYVTGEETREQVAATASRIGVASSRIAVLVERNLETIFAHAQEMRVQTIVVNSIQTMLCDNANGQAGSTTQLKECTARFVQYAKTTKTALWLIGHVADDGAIPWPKMIEHDVDVVLELDRGPRFDGNERILHCSSKNRFGPANTVGYFELTPIKGFVSIKTLP